MPHLSPEMEELYKKVIAEMFSLGRKLPKGSFRIFAEKYGVKEYTLRMKYWKRVNQKPSPFTTRKAIIKSDSPNLTLGNEFSNVNSQPQSAMDKPKRLDNFDPQSFNKVYTVRLTEQNLECLGKIIAKEIWKQMPASLQMVIENSHKPEKPSIDIQVPQKEKLALTPAEAAELLGMSVNSVYRLLHDGKIPSVKLGMERKFLIPRGELIKILTSGEIIK